MLARDLRALIFHHVPLVPTLFVFELEFPHTVSSSLSSCLSILGGLDAHVEVPSLARIFELGHPSSWELPVCDRSTVVR